MQYRVGRRGWSRRCYLSSQHFCTFFFHRFPRQDYCFRSSGPALGISLCSVDVVSFASLSRVICDLPQHFWLPINRLSQSSGGPLVTSLIQPPRTLESPRHHTFTRTSFLNILDSSTPLTPRVIDSTGMLQVSSAIYLPLSHVFKTDLDANHRYNMFHPRHARIRRI